MNIPPMFANESFIITHGKKRIQVWPLFSDKQTKIVRDVTGNLYISWWPTPNDQADTPRKRSRRTWRSSDVQYKKFSLGSLSLERMLLQVLLGSHKNIIEQKTLVLICEDLQITYTLLSEDANLVGKDIKGDVIQILGLLDNVRKQSKKEAQEQFKAIILVRDSMGRINPSVLMARTVAAIERFIEETNSLVITSNIFDTLHQSIHDLNETFFAILERFQKALRKDYSFIKTHNLTPKVAETLHKRFELYYNYLLRYVGIKPFDAWVLHTCDDLFAAQLRAKTLKKQDLLNTITRMGNATKYKLLQLDVEKLIYDLTFDDIYRNMKINDVRTRVTSILSNLDKIVSDTFATREAVEFVRHYLQCAYEQINSRSREDTRTWVKHYLKRASALM